MNKETHYYSPILKKVKKRKGHLCSECKQRAGYTKHFYKKGAFICSLCASTIVINEHYKPEIEHIPIKDDIIYSAAFNRVRSFSERLDDVYLIIENEKKGKG